MCTQPCVGELRGLDDALAADVAARRGAAEEIVEVGIGAEDLGVAARVGVVDVDEGGVEAERRHGEETLAVVVRRDHGLELGVEALDVGREPGPRRQERQPEHRGAEPPLDHALVELHHGERAGLAREAEMRIERDQVERDEAEDQPPHLAGGAQHADVGSAVRDHGEVAERRAQDLADQRHGLPPRAPAADADGHAVAELGDDVAERAPLIGHGASLASDGPTTVGCEEEMSTGDVGSV